MRFTIVISAVTAAFLVAQRERKDTFARYPSAKDTLWRSLAAETLLFSQPWYAALFESRFRLDYTPRTPEFSHGNTSYVSYPAGFVLLPTLIAKARGRPPDMRLLHCLSAGAHVLTGLFVALSAFWMVTGAGGSVWVGALLAALCSWIMMLSPAAVFYFQNAWWADILGVPLCAGYISLELRAIQGRPFRGLAVLRFLLLCMGVLSDWLFYFFLFFTLLRELSGTRSPRRLHWVLVPALFLCIHFLAITDSGTWTTFLNKVRERLDFDGTATSWKLGLQSWREFRYAGLGPAGNIVYVASALAVVPLLLAFVWRWRLNPKRRQWVETCLLVTVPFHLHSWLLHQHYFGHPYEVLKFTIVVGLFPLAVASFPTGDWCRATARQLALIATVVAMGAWIIPRLPETYPFFAVAKDASLAPELEDACEQVRLGSREAEIAFSPEFGTVAADLSAAPQDHRINGFALSACARNVYFASSPQELTNASRQRGWFAALRGKDFVPVLWSKDPLPKAWQGGGVVSSFRRVGPFRVWEIPRSWIVAD